MPVRIALAIWTLLAQLQTGDLRLTVTDPAGLPVSGAVVEIVSQTNQLTERLRTDAAGRVLARRLPVGLYRVGTTVAGFAPYARLVEIRSAVPTDFLIALQLAPITAAVTIGTADTLLDPHQTAAPGRLGADTLTTRLMSLPGRGFVDLVNTQPGWLLEANGILHPRGSEYQVQYIVDGVPLTDNRSPAFLADADAEDVRSLNVLTAGYPAEYGRKLGGVVEVATIQDVNEGLHGDASLEAGSLGTVGGTAFVAWRHDRDFVHASAAGGRTDRFLDPPTPANHSNDGRTTAASARYERDITDADRLVVSGRRQGTRLHVPNEELQENAGQRQLRASDETAGQFSYQRVLSSAALLDVRGLVRDSAATLDSNAQSTPIVAAQDRRYREAYVKAASTVHAGRHDVRFGGELDFARVREAFAYRITDPAAFEPGTRQSFDFAGSTRDREVALFAQDTARAGKWTVTGGLRWDHYALLVSDAAWSPRLGLAYYVPAADVVLRGSYDRVFQTPAFENLLVASSSAIESVSQSVLRLPVQPSRGNFYQVGASKALARRVRLDVNVYRREFTNFADDELLLNTGVSFPIAFRRATVHGAELKIDAPRVGAASASLSYAYMAGVGSLPVTGGLFIGSEQVGAASRPDGTFPISQDQRHTLAGRLRYQFGERYWAAVGGTYGSGLPTEFDGDRNAALAQYGPEVVNRVDFESGRVRWNVSLDASAAATLRRSARVTLSIQADVVNVTDRLNVINFAGVFSGTAIAVPRRAGVRLRCSF